MSDFDHRWQALATASRQAAPEALPPVPQRRWLAGGAAPRAAPRRDERTGWLVGGLALGAVWVLAVCLAPLAFGPGTTAAAPTPTASPAAATTQLPIATPGLAMRPTTDAAPAAALAAIPLSAPPLILPGAHVSAALPALPHPPAVADLLARAYLAFTDPDPVTDPHL